MSRLQELLLPPATKLGQGYVFTRVCDSVHKRGLPIAYWITSPRDQRQAHHRADTPPGPEAGTPPNTPPGTRGRHPPGADNPPQTRGRPPPPGSRHAPVQCMLGDTGNMRVVRILLECNLVIHRILLVVRSIRCSRTFNTNASRKFFLEKKFCALWQEARSSRTLYKRDPVYQLLNRVILQKGSQLHCNSFQSVTRIWISDQADVAVPPICHQCKCSVHWKSSSPSHRFLLFLWTAIC